MAVETEKPKKKSRWKRLFSGFNENEPIHDSPVSGIACDLSSMERLLNQPLQTDDASHYEPLKTPFPTDRTLQYKIYDEMAVDPSIDAALKMHIQHALSATTDTNEIIFIESKDGQPNQVISDLNDTFRDLFNAQLHNWAYEAAKYGVCYVRPYGAEGKGIQHIRHDRYTHPLSIKEFERAGLLAGYRSKHQPADQRQQLIEPWKVVSFKIPQWSNLCSHQQHQPSREHTQFNLASDDYENDPVVETTHYGESLLRAAFDPWQKLEQASTALSVARWNAGKKDRFIGVNVGQESPQKAAGYFNTIAKILKQKSDHSSNQAMSKGFFNTINNLVFPVWSSGSGKVDIQTEVNDVNIASIEDVNFIVNRLASALSVDKSLLGFTDDLSGGLGDGGFFRMAIAAAIKANLVRNAVRNGIERLFEIHVAYKYNKVYTPDDKPWVIKFNSINTALEQEQAQAQEVRANFATSVVSLIQLIDPEFQLLDKKDALNWVMTELMQFQADDISPLFTSKKPSSTQDQPSKPNEPKHEQKQTQ
ncbi:portal protein [Spartinivicinus marinus]|nr:portal protein [Spartinivicinus marinus]MCX4030385.1 portal protein [Spartinivicinus marinus]